MPYLGTALLAACFAAAAGMMVNVIFTPGRAKWYLITRNDNGFLRLALQAVREERPISVTLKNRKVYVGFVIRTPGLRPSDQYISVLPYASGYREADTLDLVFTQNYARVYDQTKFEPSDFAVTFPLSEIQSANLFIPSAHPLFQDPGLELPTSAARAAAAGETK